MSIIGHVQKAHGSSCKIADTMNQLPMIPAKILMSRGPMRGARNGCEGHSLCCFQSPIASCVSRPSNNYFISNLNFGRKAWGVDSANHNKHLIALQTKKEVLSKSIKQHHFYGD